MPMRLSGLMSGMDTESIVAQLVEAKKTKVTKAVKAQKSLKYKQDAWKDLNKQILNLYNKSISNMRFESAYIKKTTKVSNSSIVSVITGEKAMNSVQNLQVKELASTGFLTGGELPQVIDPETNKKVDVTGKTTLGQLGLASGNGSIDVEVGGKTTSIKVNENTTIDSFVNELQKAGLSVNFDEGNQRLYVAAKSSGAKNDFKIKASDGQGFAALKALKLSYGYDDEELKASYQKIVEMNKDGKEVDSRVEKTLKNLTDSRTNLLTRRDNLLKYADAINAKLDALAGGTSSIKIDKDFDYEALSEEDQKKVDAAIDAAMQDGTAPDEMVRALKTWVNDWKSNTTSLKDVESKLDIDRTDSTNPVVTGLAQTEKDKIVTQVEKEIKDATDVLAELKQYDNLSEEEREKKIEELGYGQKATGGDATIYLNGVKYTSDKNTFDVNGLTLTVSAKTADNETVTITTEDDTNGIYDMIKGFIKEYSTLINKMDKLYNADSAKGYDPLTDEEKEAMSDSQIEEWETKIKDSILRKDGTLGNFANELKRIMMEGVEVNGKKMYLSNFGIGTLSYFSAPENEKNAYHIDGDPDDESTSGNPDKLKAMIANDPDTVVSFFTKLSQNLYSKMFEMMKAEEGISSSMTAYEDKKMQSDYDDYTAKIKELEKKLADYEDKWYAKFAAMETALAKMQNNASAVTSLLGG